MKTAQVTDHVTDYLDRTGVAADGATPDRIRDLGDGAYVIIRSLLFHWMMVRGDFENLIGYWDRWCYADETGASAALDDFPDKPTSGYQPVGWHRHPSTGRRRPDGDPSREYRDG
jgi:hypothetical protein